MPKENVVIDLSKAIEQGVAIRVGSDLTIGSVTDTPRISTQVTRPVETYDGEPPQDPKDGKVAIDYRITKRCGFKETQNAKPCERFLFVRRVKHEVFVEDESGFGGQLEYEEKGKDAIRQYAYCKVHGTIGPANWEPNRRKAIQQ